MKIFKNKLFPLCTLALVFSAPHALAQINTFYAPGDLVLFFQKDGDTDTVYVSLGDTATVFRGAAAGPGAANALNILNINATLESAFGAGWASDTSIYAGLCGTWSSSNTTTALQNGDPARTLYVSRPRNAVGTVGLSNSTTWNLSSAGDGAMTSGATGILQNNNPFDLNFNVRQTVALTSVSAIDEQNPFTIAGGAGVGVQGFAFANTFGGGVQQVGSASSFGTFGAAGAVEFALDLYRIVARNNISGQVAGTQRVGSYEGTVTLDASGVVSFISQGTSTPYATWATTNGVTGQAANLDHDNDGVSNGVEHFLVGPSTVSTGFTPLPGITTVGPVNSVTWAKAGTYTGVYGTDFWVETSTSLGTGSWTNETLGVNVVITGNNVKYTFPAGPVKTFARLKVTGP